jgi:hypothetical protein
VALKEVMDEQLDMMEVTHMAQSKFDAPNVQMGDPHNQDVVQAIFIEDAFVVEVGRSATSKAIDRCPLQAHLRTRELYM